MDDFNPRQLITLCAVFIGIHVLALPAFVWGMRRRQFAGREQKEWNLDETVSPDAPIAPSPPAPLSRRARVLLGVLGIFAAAMLGAVVFTVYIAIHATGHAAPGQTSY